MTLALTLVDFAALIGGLLGLSGLAALYTALNARPKVLTEMQAAILEDLRNEREINKKEIAELRAENAALKARVTHLEIRLARYLLAEGDAATS